MSKTFTEAMETICNVAKGEFRTENLPAPVEQPKMLDALFQGRSHVRVRIDENNKPWFVAKDVCDILEIVNVSHACATLKPSHKGIAKDDTLGGTQSMTTVDVPGLFKLVFKSRSDSAEAFQDWVYEEVLPSIVATGSYVDKQRIMELENEKPVIGESARILYKFFGDDDAYMRTAYRMDELEGRNKSLSSEVADMAVRTDRLQMKKGDALLKNNDNLLKAQRKFMNDSLRKTRDPFKRIRKLLKDRPYEYEPTLRAELAAIEDVIERIAACGE